MDQFLRKNLWVINLLSLALLAFFMASGTGALLGLLFVTEPGAAVGGPVVAARRPEAKTKRFDARSGRDICVNNVFEFETRPCAEEFVEAEEELEEEVEETGGVPPYCEGDAKLVATMASTDADWGFAMIKSGDKTMPYRVGDNVPDFGKVMQVGWRLVLVDPPMGSECLLDLYPPPIDESSSANARPSSPVASAGPPRPSRRGMPSELQKQIESGIEVVSANERNVDRGLVDSLIENSSSLMSQARVLPYERDGVVQGFKLYGIRRDSLLGKLGLRNGDIVNEIGGVEMTSPDRALSAYTKLRNANHLTLTFTRRGRRQTMDFNIR
jgi:general secretion pathway protein C